MNWVSRPVDNGGNSGLASVQAGYNIPSGSSRRTQQKGGTYGWEGE